MQCNTSATLLRAASALRARAPYIGAKVPLADVLTAAAASATRSFEAVQSPSYGVDLPAGIAHGDPVRAEQIVAASNRHLLAVAREVLGEDTSEAEAS